MSANNKKSRWLGLALRLLVSLALLAWIGMRTDWQQVGVAFANLRFEFWLGAASVLALTQFVSSMRWQLFAQELRFQPTVLELCGYYFIGMFFNLVLPTSVGGDVVRAWYLDAGSGRRLAAFASVFLDRLNGLLVLIALACLSLFFLPAESPAWVSWSVAAIAGSAILGLASLPLLRQLPQLPPRRREQLDVLLQILHAPKLLLATTSLSLVVQSANILLVWMIGVGLQLDVPFAYYWVFVPMVTLLTLLPLSVNGMGVREGGTVLFLAPLGVPYASALTLAFLWFAVFAVASVIGGFIYMVGHYAPPPPDSEGANHGSVDRGADQGREGQLTSAA